MTAANTNNTIPPAEPAPTSSAAMTAAGATTKARSPRSSLLMFLVIVSSSSCGSAASTAIQLYIDLLYSRGELMPLPQPLPDELVELIARRFRVLGEPMRIKLLDRLRE